MALNPHPRSDCKPGCFGCKVRTVSLSVTPFVPHFNWSVGKYVNTVSELKSELTRAADDNSERTGVDHHYEYRAPGDISAPPHRDHDQVLDDRAANIRAVELNKPLKVTA